MKNEDKIKLVMDQFPEDTDPVFLDGFKQGMIFVMEANQALAKKVNPGTNLTPSKKRS